MGYGEPRISTLQVGFGEIRRRGKRQSHHTTATGISICIYVGRTKITRGGTILAASNGWKYRCYRTLDWQNIQEASKEQSELNGLGSREYPTKIVLLSAAYPPSPERNSDNSGISWMSREHQGPVLRAVWGSILQIRIAKIAIRESERFEATG